MSNREFPQVAFVRFGHFVAPFVALFCRGQSDQPTANRQPVCRLHPNGSQFVASPRLANDGVWPLVSNLLDAAEP